MSVTTTADRKLELARYHLALAGDHIEKAREALREALHRETWGSDEFSADFREGVERVIRSLGRPYDRLVERLGKRWGGVPEGFVPLEGCSRRRHE